MIKKLALDEILEINDQIWRMAQKSRDIEYGGHNDYIIREDRVKYLIDNTPNEGLTDIAAYYLKNLILLQSFADANHQTAFEAVIYFFHKNNVSFRWDLDSVDNFQMKIYDLRLKIYGTYEEKSISVLKEPKNELYDCCKIYIEKTIEMLKLTEFD
jgi:prophage maintenance system killer protein